jgi:hypothetical protein
MRHIYLIVIYFLLAINFLSSCKKDENSQKTIISPTDIRDLAIGTYSGIQTFTSPSDSTTIDTIAFAIAKGSGSSLIITEDSISINTGSVVVAGNDLAGNIPLQKITIDGFNIEIQGIGNTNEHFGFMESTKIFTYDIQFIDGPLAGCKLNVFGSKK